MKIIKLADGLFEVTASRIVDADHIHDNLSFLHKAGMLTFGDLTTRILHDEFTRLGYSVHLTDLCFEDDLSIGLQMPETWYLNCGLYAPSISMYFNFLNLKEMAKEGVLYTRNAHVCHDFGHISAIEVYIQEELLPSLDVAGKRYFGTPRTLTECMRVLEGWDMERLPRLGRYITYANFIRLWCSMNFPNYRSGEWGLGKEASRKVLRESGTTNVREGIKFFWQNYLEARSEKVSLEDLEIDILDPGFQEFRQPRYVLVGEDIFADEWLDTGHEMVFRSFSESKIIRYPRLVTPNGKQLKTAKLIQKRFPSSTVIMFKNPITMPSFTMTKYDEVKEGVSREVAVVASSLRHIHTMLEGRNDKQRLR
ncbi:MAG: hypothetical protein AAB351_03930 [Patescibacteria group bacterium]